MYERILVPLDGSEMSEEILPHVVKLARTFRAEVLLVRATTPAYQLTSESVTPTAPELGLDIAKQRQSTERAVAEQYLSQVADRLAAEGINCKSAVPDPGRKRRKTNWGWRLSEDALRGGFGPHPRALSPFRREDARGERGSNRRRVSR